MARTDAFAKSSWVLTLAAVAVVVAALYLAKSVLIPLTLAVFLSFLLAPLCDRLERLKLGRIPAVIITALLAFVLLGTVGWIVAVQVGDLAAKLPEYQKNVEAKLYALNGYARGAITRISQTKDQISQRLADAESDTDPKSEVLSRERSYLVRMDQPSTNPLLIAGRLFGSMLQLFGTAGIVIIFVIFFLIRREDLRDRFIRLIGQGTVTTTTQALGDAAERVSRYLLTQLFINAIYGAPVAIALYFIGVPNAVLWGLLATILRFIPYLGPWIAASMPICLSLAISPGWKEPVLTVGLFVALELFSNNVIEPWLYGKRTGVSPAAVLVAAVFWTWLWGPAGLFLATPLTVCLVVIGKHVPQLSFLNILLGDDPVFKPNVHVYQRLLAGDQEEAAEFVEECLKEQPLVDVYDTVLVPVLAMAETDRHRGELDEDQHENILQSLREMIDELGEKQSNEDGNAAGVTDENDGTGAAADSPPRAWANHCVLCLPARDEADAIAATMLAQLLGRSGWSAEAVSATALASEMIELVAKREADVVCISATPPAALLHARYLCKRLRQRFPQANVVIGLWNTSSDLSKAKERIGRDDTVRVASTFAETEEQVRQLMQPLLIGTASLQK